MAIDEQTQAFLDRAGANPPPPPGSVPLAAFRDAVKNMKPLDYDFEDVAEVKDLVIARETDDLSVRIYRPEAPGRLPIFVWAHGGSWVRSTVDAADNLFRVLANRSQAIIVGVEYRLAPECQLPGPIEDVYDALVWAHDHADEIGGDATRLAVGGESSGGNLAAAAALRARDGGGPALGQQVLVAPVLDAALDSDSWQALDVKYLLGRAQMEWAIEQYAPGIDRSDPRLSPLRADVTGLPPTLIITGEFDPLKDDGAAYAAKLDAAGVPVRHIRVDGLIHHALLAPKAIELGARVLMETAESMGAGARE
jgi:acetyl esterase/lipase